MKNKVCFIIPHFGKLQNYFPLFLKTCAYNPAFHWLIVTDDDRPYAYPTNVKRIAMTFGELKELITSKINFPIALERPYKLCDFRPLYGHIFSNYLTGYTHWGHCDTDTIMGNLEQFISDEMLDYYDKIFQLGHMSIYKNTAEINQIALTPYQGKEIGKEILQNPQNCWFDEEWDPEHNVSINKILKEQNKKIYEKDLSLNISFSHNRFVRGEFVGTDKTDMPYGFEIESLKEALYLWEKGNLYRLFMRNGLLIREDYPYMHLQQRKMKLHREVINLDKFEIIPDEFRPFRYSYVDANNFKFIEKPCYSHLQLQLFLKRLKNYIKRYVLE